MGNSMCSINSVEGSLTLIYTQVQCFLAENLWSRSYFEQQSPILLLQVFIRCERGHTRVGLKQTCATYSAYTQAHTILYLQMQGVWITFVEYKDRKKSLGDSSRTKKKKKKTRRTLNPSLWGIQRKRQQQNNTRGNQTHTTSNNPLEVLYEEGNGISGISSNSSPREACVNPLGSF